MLSSVDALLGLLAGYLAWHLYSARRNKKRRLNFPLPPGPKGHVVIGNLLDLPAESQWLTLDRWFKDYGESANKSSVGDIVHVNVMGQHMVFLGSTRTSSLFFENKSAVYSDRPPMTMVLELMGWDFFLPGMRYGARWREQRRVFHEHFHRGVVSQYHPAFLHETHKLLLNLLTEPGSFLQHLRLAFTAMIMAATYGIEVQDRRDPYIAISDKAMEGISQAGVPGAFLVNYFPSMKHIPPWVPGAGFQGKALQWKKDAQEMLQKPMEAVKKALREGKGRPSIATKMLQELPPNRTEEHHERLIQDMGATAYGVSQTVSTAQVFIIAMAMHPQVQQRAQAELDKVVGLGRLPDFADRDSLPYINAIMKELTRWQPVLPVGFRLLAVPRASMADDVVNGYFIPEGSVVAACSWSILHDPEHYPHPEEFRPERFLREDGGLDPKVQDPNVAVFGYGRRICPGRHFSDRSLYLVVASILATFDIEPSLDQDGKLESLRPVMLSGLISHPAPFNCVVKPRTPFAADLIRKSCEESVY
ncbi:cytochrome P450 [Heliocybe sulcata]|uniref:Cytochrome P450 n=1 Tax=Heliocybe sulcata TaxID=5364 RepID=A0A5C3MTI5_9AGAM|nr:cytochrome P450 [Heliocybe sulcata]